jgi:hypothetical protein
MTLRPTDPNSPFLPNSVALITDAAMRDLMVEKLALERTLEALGTLPQAQEAQKSAPKETPKEEK